MAARAESVMGWEKVMPITASNTGGLIYVNWDGALMRSSQFGAHYDGSQVLNYGAQLPMKRWVQKNSIAHIIASNPH
jgi:hypothetical protein